MRDIGFRSSGSYQSSDSCHLKFLGGPRCYLPDESGFPKFSGAIGQNRYYGEVYCLVGYLCDQILNNISPVCKMLNRISERDSFIM